MTWQILVMRNSAHDKFWAYDMNTEAEEYRARFGRIGSVGVEVIYDVSKLDTKIKEKLNKGYREATQEEIDNYFSRQVLLAWEV